MVSNPCPRPLGYLANPTDSFVYCLFIDFRSKICNNFEVHLKEDRIINVFMKWINFFQAEKRENEGIGKKNLTVKKIRRTCGIIKFFSKQTSTNPQHVESGF